MEKTASFSHEATPPGKFTAIRQVQGKAGKSIHESGTASCLVRITRVRHSPVIAGQVHTDKTGLRTSQEMGPNPQGPCQAWL